MLPADKDKVPLIETQEKPEAGFVKAVQNLEGAIGNAHTVMDKATNALADLKASLAVLGFAWPESIKPPRIGEIKRRQDPTGSSREASASASDLSNTHLSQITLDVQKEALLRVESSFAEFKRALKDAELWDARAVRAGSKSMELLDMYNQDGFARVANSMLDQLKYTEQLKELEQSMSTWDSILDPQVRDAKRKITSEWNDKRLKMIHSSVAESTK